MILPLAYYGDAVLRKKALPVEVFDDDLRKFIEDMEETRASTKALGIAAPQVHRSIRVFVVNIPSKDSNEEYQPGTTRIFINPKILEISEEKWMAQEGCLSIPKLYEDVERPLRVKVEAQDPYGKTFVQEFKSWEAKVILHENDHINGVLFIDRIHGKKRKMLESFLNEIKRKYSKF